MRPKVVSDYLVLNIVFPEGQKAGREVYAVYHGRFIEMMQAHFDERFIEGVAMALLAHGDRAAA